MKTAKPVFLAGLFLALALLAGCQREEHSRSASGSHQGISGLTETTTYAFALPEGSDEINLLLDIRSQAGSFAWRVTDPSGQAVWDGSLDAGGSIQEKRACGLPGSGSSKSRWSMPAEASNSNGKARIERGPVYPGPRSSGRNSLSGVMDLSASALFPLRSTARAKTFTTAALST